MKNTDLVATVVLTWNNARDISECLKSLQKQTYKNNKILVVDNASTDNTLEIVRKNFPKVELLALPKNSFFTGGFNQGMKWVWHNWQSDYTLIINPDTKAETNMLAELVKGIKTNHKIGAVGPKIKFWQGGNHGKLYSCGIYFDGFTYATQRGHLENDRGQFNIRKEVFGIEGTCILFRTKALTQVGLFWEKLKMYLEDVELFMRMNKCGWKAVYCPKAVLWHKVMQSTKQNKKMNVEQQKMRNWLLIAFRHYRIKSKLAMLKRYLKFKFGLL